MVSHIFSSVDDALKEKIFIFDSHFYDKLILTNDKNPGRKHDNVARWTKKVDLFQKQMLVIPVCQHKHWFLILVINPGVITVNVLIPLFFFLINFAITAG